MASVWSIRYYNKVTGETQYYMNIGFLSKEEAERELRLINRDRKRHNLSDEKIQETIRKGFYVPTCCVGENFEVVERKIKNIPNEG